MVIKFKPLFFDKIWGGSYFQTLYGPTVSSQCGEVWGISGLEVASNVVDHPAYEGMTLRTLFQDHPQLFGHYHAKEFPILVKLIDAATPLSVQVHPDNRYAQSFASLGKEECWTILKAKPEAELIIGHQFDSPEKVLEALEDKSFMRSVQKVPVQVDDFYYIPTGTLHAIGAGITLLEVQQSSDLTFRLYDYERLENGHTRTLHLNDALAVMRYPDERIVKSPRDDFFHYQRRSFEHTSSQKADAFGDYIYVIKGQGWIDEVAVKEGDFMMISALDDYVVRGPLTLQITHLV